MSHLLNLSVPLLLICLVNHAPAGDEKPGPASAIREELGTISAARERALARYAKDYEPIEAMMKGGAQAEAISRATVDAEDRLSKIIGDGVDRLLALVQAHPDDPAAVEALTFVVTNARGLPTDQSRQALGQLLHSHVRDPKISQLTWKVFPLFYVPEAEGLVRAVMEQNPDRNERGRACHDLVFFLRYQADAFRGFRKKPEKLQDYPEPWRRGLIEPLVREKDPEALAKEAEALLERCLAEFADVPGVGYHDGRTIGDLARGELFDMRHLVVGKVVPEIRGVDADDRAFQLSDYRGKVVVLTFSGNWCGPCRGMYPQLRDMVERLKDRPFAIVSVDTDKDRETLRKSIRDGEITWRCWWDGGTDGPISTAWGVNSFPLIYVLDRDGVIRFKDVRGEELDKAVAGLLDGTPSE